MPDSQLPLADSIQQAVENYVDSNTVMSLAAMRAVRDVDVDANSVTIWLQLGYPESLFDTAARDALQQSIAPLAGERDIALKISSEVLAHQTTTEVPALSEVKNIIAVASGKGGVGKSATAVNLALALREQGASVGLLDADIYGPSQPIMLGIAEGTRPEIQQQKFFLPIQAHGLQTMSMGYMVTEKTPMVWRGPMVSGALMQMIGQTRWSSLDYLLIDMPPGTGDLQLTLAQQVPCSGSVIVTTPQNIALLDAKKGIEMFRKVGIPCFGVVENMSTHICSQCGHEESVFGADGGVRIAAEYDVPLLGALPLDSAIREHLDEGRPTLIAEPDSAIAGHYRQIARKLALALFVSARQGQTSAPDIIISDD